MFLIKQKWCRALEYIFMQKKCANGIQTGATWRKDFSFFRHSRIQPLSEAAFAM